MKISDFKFWISDRNRPALAVFFLAIVWVPVRADELELKNGQKLQGTVKRLDGAKLVFEAKLGGGTAEVPCPLDQVVRLTFERAAAQQRLLDAGTAADIPELQAWWEQRRPFLSIPGSDSGEIGLALMRRLLEKKDRDSAATVLELAGVLAAGDWNTVRKEGVVGCRLQALIQSGKTEQAMAEADKLLEVSPDNMTVLLEARFIRARGAAEKWREIEEKHPHWQEEKDRVAERRALYNQALDEFLYPAVFCAEQVPQAARGLWHAAELYAANGDAARAAVCAQEITKEFPDPEYMRKAREWLDQNKSKITKEKE